MKNACTFFALLLLSFSGVVFAFDQVGAHEVNLTILPDTTTAESMKALDGLYTKSLKFTIQGSLGDLVTASGTTEIIAIEQLRILVNESSYRVEVDSDGYFTNTYPINPGENLVALQILDDSWEPYTTDHVTITVAPMRLDARVEITWNQVAGTDIDLHIFKEAEMNSVYKDYDTWASNGLPHVGWTNDHPTNFSPSAAANPYLDIKVPTGYGPETIVIHEMEDTFYHIWVHAYALPSDGRPVRVEMRIFVGGYEYYFDYVFTEPWSTWYIASLEGGTGLVVSVLPEYVKTW